MIVAIIQARMGSSRLPGKVLAEIAGHPMLWHVVQRASCAQRLDRVVVATTTSAEDDAVAEFCGREAIPCFRGSAPDVLDRYYQAAKREGADVLVRVTADCPLIDPAIIDRVVERFLRGDCDYASNTLHCTYPDGLDIEVFSFAALQRAWREARRPSEREHVTPYLRGTSFRVAGVETDARRGLARLRWSVDESADLQFVRAVYSGLYRANDGVFGMEEVLSYLETHPALQHVNASITANEGYFRSLFAEAEAGAAPPLQLVKSREWFARSQRVIPGCAQTFSKGYTQQVQGVAPLFLQRGQGCRVWDVDGNEYIDFIQGLLPNILGYAHPEVNAAAQAQAAQGHSFSLPHPLEVELAERLTNLIPCAEMVRFGKNGSDATSGAVRAARAFTGRERIACCGYHGWQDWYIGSTTRHAGVPGAVRDLTHPFTYNDLASLERVLESHRGEFAAVILEPANFGEPQPGFLQGVKDLAHGHGALLIFDEICTGWHFGLGGAQKLYGVIPDLACFGKAMGNGYPISCVVGGREVMRQFEEIFFSFTFAGEVASMAAAMKVIDILENTDALARMEEAGSLLKNGFNTFAKEAGLAGRLECVGHPRWSLMKFRNAAANDCALTRSLFLQEISKRGVLSLGTHNLCAAHDRAAVEETLRAYAATIKTLARWLQDRAPQRFLEGAVIQPVFRARG